MRGDDIRRAVAIEVAERGKGRVVGKRHAFHRRRVAAGPVAEPDAERPRIHVIADLFQREEVAETVVVEISGDVRAGQQQVPVDPRVALARNLRSRSARSNEPNANGPTALMPTIS